MNEPLTPLTCALSPSLLTCFKIPPTLHPLQPPTYREQKNEMTGHWSEPLNVHKFTWIHFVGASCLRTFNLWPLQLCFLLLRVLFFSLYVSPVTDCLWMSIFDIHSRWHFVDSMFEHLHSLFSDNQQCGERERERVREKIIFQLQRTLGWEKKCACTFQTEIFFKLEKKEK